MWCRYQQWLTTLLSVTGYVADVQELYSDLAANPSFISVLDGLATVDRSVLSAFQAVTTASDISGVVAIITGLPSPYNSILNDIYAAEISVASENGIITDGQVVSSIIPALSSILPSISSVFASDISTAIATGGAAAPTGMIAMGAVAGAVGGLAALL